MFHKFIEVTDGFNWGKFAIAKYDQHDWGHLSQVSGTSLLREIGWDQEHFWLMDLQTCEGAAFRPGGLAAADLNKHRIWVCPMFEPFLTWLHKQDLSDIQALPSVVSLSKEETAGHNALSGYRRQGPQA